MNTFFIARHGETDNNRAHRLSGWIDTPLTSDGLVPTEEVVGKLADLSVDAVYSSDLGRAFITAYAISRELGFEKQIERLPGLREVNYGDAANMLSAEAYNTYPGLDSDTYYTPPNGESLEVMQRRVLATVTRIDAIHAAATILLVCHSGVMAALQSSYLKQDFGVHNSSVAYPHNYVGRFQFVEGAVRDFQEYVG